MIPRRMAINAVVDVVGGVVIFIVIVIVGRGCESLWKILIQDQSTLMKNSKGNQHDTMTGCRRLFFVWFLWLLLLLLLSSSFPSRFFQRLSIPVCCVLFESVNVQSCHAPPWWRIDMYDVDGESWVTIRYNILSIKYLCIRQCSNLPKKVGFFFGGRGEADL